MAGNDRSTLGNQVDSIINELGIGKFQFVVFVVIAIAMFVNCMTAYLYILTTREPEYRCRIPECDSKDVEYKVSWVANAIPLSKMKPEKCLRFSPIKATKGLNDSCSQELFNRSILEPCEDYVYGEGNTIVKEFDIACQEWKRVLVGTINGAGQFSCLIFFGFLSDKYGRKITIFCATFVTGIIRLVQSFLIEYWSFLLVEFFNTVLTTGTYGTVYLLGVELLTPEKRVVGAMFINLFVSLSLIILGAAAWILPYWRTLTRVVNLPCFLIIIFVSVAPESIRWLIINGKHREAARVICKAAKLNNCKLSDETLRYVELLKSGSIKLQGENKPREIEDAVSILSVMKSKKILLRLLVCAFCWLTNFFVYNGLHINAVTLSSDRSNTYLNFILVAAVDLPSHIAYLYAIRWLGRRKSLSFSLIAFALLSVLFALIPDDQETLLLIIYLTIKLFVTLSFSVLFIYTAEMFPTTFRNTCMGFCSMLGTVGIILAPQTALLAQYHASLPMVIYAVIAFLSGLTVLIFPETSNMRLPDTITEAENIEFLTPKSKDIRHTNEQKGLVK